MTGPQLRALAKRVPDHLISSREVAAGFHADYVAHSTITEKLLATLGAFSWSVDILRDRGELCYVVGTIEATVDGELVRVSGIGDGDDPLTAESTALKRAAMRLGCGLHLWSQGAYSLDAVLDKRFTDGLGTTDDDGEDDRG